MVQNIKKKQTSFWGYLLFVALVISNNVIVNFVGELTIGFIFILFTISWWYRKLDFSNPILSKILKAYIILIGVQCFCELFSPSDVSIITKAKGVAVTISSLVIFLYFFYRFKEDLNLVKYYFLASAVALILMPNRLSEIEGSEFGYYKFTLVPIIMNITIFVALSLQKRFSRKFLSVAICLIGFFIVITGARSYGVILIVSGLISYLVLRGKSIRTKDIYKIAVVLFLILYAIYSTVYVPMVLSGDLDGVGNTEQLKKVENPYNPMYLLMQGRTSSFIAFIAFSDKPIVGYGYRAQDPNLKYRKLMAIIADEEAILRSDATAIPCHSVIGAYAAYYGIGGLLGILYLFTCVFNMGIVSFLSRDKYMFAIVYLLFNISWTMLFSPISHFKMELPIMMSFIVALYITRNTTTKIIKKDTSDNNS